MIQACGSSAQLVILLVGNGAAASPAYTRGVEEFRDDHDRLVLKISRSPDTTLLRLAGDALTNDMGFEQLDRFHAPEAKWWDFELQGVRLFLHWDQTAGLTITANDTEPGTENLTRKVHTLLVAKLSQAPGWPGPDAQ